MTQCPAIVHVDVDFYVFRESMDELFDAMLYPKDSPDETIARTLIPLEQPNGTIPGNMDAFFTHDWSQVRADKSSCVQRLQYDSPA